jgi:5-oxoprolinase (ATP-hydrolysing)
VQYYETISGGSGAGGRFDEHGVLVGGFDGTSVVQTHMTNSRLTDPEVLEFRFPVRLLSYEIRRGSGGAGRWKGGDGGCSFWSPPRRASSPMADSMRLSAPQAEYRAPSA